MRVRSRRGLASIVAAVVLLASFGGAARAQTAGPPDPDSPPPLYTFNNGLGPGKGDNVILLWNEELLQAIRANPAGTGPTITARALGVAHTAMFDAWAPYDAWAVGTRYGKTLRRPVAERTPENKAKAVSFAAYAALVDLFPSRQGDVALQMKELGYATDGSDTSMPATIGTMVAKAVTDYRHKDGANQLAGYTDTTGYQPVNTPDQVIDRWRWQPLRVPLGTGNPQRALTPQWAEVVPFGMSSQFGRDVPLPPRLPNGDWSPADIVSLERETEYLDDPSRMKAEYWADGPRSEFPPGHWSVFAQAISRKRGNSLDDDVKLFFALGNALMDASIAAWAWKFKVDYVRPITGIREYFRGQTIVSWLGPYKGYGPVEGENWIPYQELTVVTPPFPEYVSGHSTFSGAGARVIRSFLGSDNFGASVTIRAGTSRFEPRTDTHPGSPARDVTLYWPTFSAAAAEAGQSRRYGGIHFPSGDLHGRSLGDAVGGDAWTKAQSYIRPFSPGPI
jgi:hypothetical protein